MGPELALPLDASDADLLGDASASDEDTRPATPLPPPAPPNTRMRAATNLRHRPADAPVGSTPACWTVDPDADAADLDDGSALTGSVRPSGAASSAADERSSSPGGRLGGSGHPRHAREREWTPCWCCARWHQATGLRFTARRNERASASSSSAAAATAAAVAAAVGSAIERERGARAWIDGWTGGGGGQASQRTRDKVATPASAVVAESEASAIDVTVAAALARDSAMRAVGASRPDVAAPSASLPSTVMIAFAPTVGGSARANSSTGMAVTAARLASN